MGMHFMSTGPLELQYYLRNALKTRCSDTTMLSLIRSKSVKRRTILFGLKSDNCGREILLRLLSLLVREGDSVLAIHVQRPAGSFNPNTFHIHEDVCKSKEVDFQVKVCEGDCFISKLTHQVRENCATVLALGCSYSGLKHSLVSVCLKRLPPTCTLLVIDSRGRILVQTEGTCQKGSIGVNLQTSPSPTPKDLFIIESFNTQKPLSSPPLLPKNTQIQSCKRKEIRVPESITKQLFRRLALLDSNRSIRHFTLDELNSATDNFNPEMIIGEGGHSKVYAAKLSDGRAVAVKVLNTMYVDDLLREVEILSDIKHVNIVEIVGFCTSKHLLAIVYNLLQGSLRQWLKQLKWSERMTIAIGAAKALTYIHDSCDPPIIHRDVKSTNILLSNNRQPQLSDFGAATVLHRSESVQANSKPYDVVGTFGYLAPEYMMYGKIDEKIDVYSYGVVLLELITGKEAIQTDQNNHESLVLWARSLFGCGLRDRLIDPHLNNDFDKKEMEVMMMAARLCLLYSSSRRPTMKAILRLLEDPEYLAQMRNASEKLLAGNEMKPNRGLWRNDDESDAEETLTLDDNCPVSDNMRELHALVQ